VSRLQRDRLFFGGFGDSCKFLHTREDSTYCWKLDGQERVGTKGAVAEDKSVTLVNGSSPAGKGTPFVLANKGEAIRHTQIVGPWDNFIRALEQEEISYGA
jgi:hypothetical protein